MIELIPSFAVTLDKERHLCFDLGAMSRFQECFGESLIEAVERVQVAFLGARDAKDITAQKAAARVIPDLGRILWVGLLRDDDTLTLAQVGHLFSMRSMPQIFPALLEAFRAAMPEAAPENPTPAAKPAAKVNGTGVEPGPSLATTSESAAKSSLA